MALEINRRDSKKLVGNLYVKRGISCTLYKILRISVPEMEKIKKKIEKWKNFFQKGLEILTEICYTIRNRKSSKAFRGK